jgi:CRP-like cAMP-binding protein
MALASVVTEKTMFTRHLCQLLKPRVFMAGAMVIKSHEISDEMYFIKSGQVQVLPANNTDAHTGVCLLSTNDYFGEVGVALPQQLRTASVLALTIVECLSLSRPDWLQLMYKSVDHHDKIMLNLLGHARVQYLDLTSMLNQLRRNPKTLLMRTKNVKTATPEPIAVVEKAY